MILHAYAEERKAGWMENPCGTTLSLPLRSATALSRWTPLPIAFFLAEALASPPINGPITLELTAGVAAYSTRAHEEIFQLSPPSRFEVHTEV